MNETGFMCPGTFVDELETLINRHSMENRSNTPDFILATFLARVLDAWNQASREREEWFGWQLTPGHGAIRLPVQADEALGG